jgi:O-antigen ligase
MTVPMMVLVFLRWLAVFGGISLGVPAEKYGADAAIRVIDGPFTFFLAHAFVLTIPAWLRGDRDRWIRWTSVPLLLFVLLLNRRTVWLAILVGVAVLMLRDRRLGRRALLLVTLGAVMTAMAFVWLGGLQGGSEPVGKTGSGNLSWRIQGWSELVDSWSRHSTDWAVGQPVGAGFAREIEGNLEASHPHNFYIEIMIRTGLAGLVALIALTAGLMRALWRAPARDVGLLGPGVLPALLAMQLVWFLTWVPGSEQGIVTGLAIAAVAAHVSRPAPSSRTAGPERGPTASTGW